MARFFRRGPEGPDCPGEIGDILLFDRGKVYDHYAVKTGFQEVVHVTGDLYAAMSESGGASVRSKMKGGVVKVQSYSEAKAETHSDKVTVIKSGASTAAERQRLANRAKGTCGKWDYHILFGNCEHFARKVVFDKWESKQSEGAAKKVALAPGVNVLGGLYFLVAKFFDRLFTGSRQLAIRD